MSLHLLGWEAPVRCYSQVIDFPSLGFSSPHERTRLWSSSRHTGITLAFSNCRIMPIGYCEGVCVCVFVNACKNSYLDTFPSFLFLPLEPPSSFPHHYIPQRNSWRHAFREILSTVACRSIHCFVLIKHKMEWNKDPFSLGSLGWYSIRCTSPPLDTPAPRKIKQKQKQKNPKDSSMQWPTCASDLRATNRIREVAVIAGRMINP